MTLKLQGIFAPLVTPFTATGGGSLDRAAFEQNVRAHMSAGLAGAVVTGSTGEAPLLDESERDSLIEWARPLISGNRLLIAGIGAESTRMTVARAKRAADRGADAVLVVAPHYFGSAMTTEALRAHYLAVAESSPIPLLFYNIPKYMHFRIEPSLVAELASHGNIVGIKDSSGDRELISEYLKATGPTFTVLTGNAQIFAFSLEKGAGGGILAVSLFAPELTRAVADAVASGDSAAAAELQARLAPLGRIIVGEMGVPAVKAAMDAVGLAGGVPRPPLRPLSPAEVERVRKLIQDAELAVAA